MQHDAEQRGLWRGALNGQPAEREVRERCASEWRAHHDVPVRQPAEQGHAAVDLLNRRGARVLTVKVDDSSRT